ncbi:3-oxoacyl-[acyl-carrier-protein] synthase III C-terminal domain-containing protein [Clostridium cibarium]|uniref:3-oxoacyl-ACP synthase n=1 Tax=Clostridium cibarium TaxID=2762247 RepID=A0ABR8PVH4_9CLOT|nr:3-oxoacyl-[acyl-carrier-protein] synthase III C-terminal domain-containing protein [Clostridium cibarium]MBD7912168.1 3-oxoacyl-ACP synthase [Clostridium cibarium]
MNNIQIRNIEIYHGSKIVGNEYYFEHFKKLGKDIKHFIEDVMGRKNRYLLDSSKENSLTMAIEASKRVLRASDLNGEDIDMIVFSSVLPEYVSPPSSFILHNAISGKENCLCHDMNVNCIGMTYALNLINGYMKADSDINTVLLVGSDFLTPQVDPDNELCYGEYGDAACAIVLERTSRDCGVIDCKVSTQTIAVDEIRFPRCGFSNMYDAEKKDLYAKWDSYQIHWFDSVINNMNSILKENNLSVEDISMFCFSQFSYSNIVKIRETMNIGESRSLYIGDTYGYTGTSSPFIVLYESIKNNKVKPGDYVMFWTIASGTSHMALLFKY